MADTPVTRRDIVLDAITHADCYCEPGDPTCEDWQSAETRHLALTYAVLAALDRPDQDQELRRRFDAATANSGSVVVGQDCCAGIVVVQDPDGPPDEHLVIAAAAAVLALTGWLLCAAAAALDSRTLWNVGAVIALPAAAIVAAALWTRGRRGC